jgi:hypothetical protein
MPTAHRKTASHKHRWSRHVTETSDALTLDEGVFARRDPRSIARSLQRSAEHSSRRKADPYRSAMSMLTFYINRAGRKLPATRKRVLEAAKVELRSLYDKGPRAKHSANRSGTARPAHRTRPRHDTKRARGHSH